MIRKKGSIQKCGVGDGAVGCEAASRTSRAGLRSGGSHRKAQGLRASGQARSLWQCQQPDTQPRKGTIFTRPGKGHTQQMQPHALAENPDSLNHPYGQKESPAFLPSTPGK